jgi:hypothetical protein
VRVSRNPLGNRGFLPERGVSVFGVVALSSDSQSSILTRIALTGRAINLFFASVEIEENIVE